MRIEVRPTDAVEGTSGLGDDVMVWSSFEMTVDHQDDSPVIRLAFEMRDGAPQCRVLELRSTDAGREVLAKDLRDLRLEDHLEAAVRQHALARNVGVDDPGGRGAVVAQVRKARRNVRRRVTPELLAEVARVYRENVDGNPTAAVAAHTGKAHRTAALYVKTAREQGFLGAATPGRKGER